MAISPDVLLKLLDEDLSVPMGELQMFRSAALRASLLKKYVEPKNSSILHTEAIDDFVSRNEGFEQPDVENFTTDAVLMRMRNIVHESLLNADWTSYKITLDSALEHGYCGPGKSLLSAECDFLTKMFNSDLSYTGNLFAHYESRISGRWLHAEVIRARNHSKGVVAGSKITSVPKDCTKNRTIAIEPTLNMFYQLGVKEILAKVIFSNFGVLTYQCGNFELQDARNKRLARIASIDGSLCTIDLKNASDSVSIDLVKWLLPPTVYKVLDLIRSHTFTTEDGVDHRLRMFSTMGNGFTFHLMTLLFCALIKAFYESKGIKPTPDNFGVFGDDIIIVNEFYTEFTDILAKIGFTVNTLKSFHTGHFRESCGGDYFKGHDVRGVYIKGLHNENQIYSAFNRLARWSSAHGIWLVRTLQYLLANVKVRPVPRHEGFDAGILLPKELYMSGQRDRNGCMFYYAAMPRLSSWKVNDDYTNPDGAIIATVGGFVRGNRVARRPFGDPQYSVVRRLTPSWDYSHDPVISSREWAMLLGCVFERT